MEEVMRIWWERQQNAVEIELKSSSNKIEVTDRNRVK
jgi:hypothetical protein